MSGTIYDPSQQNQPPPPSGGSGGSGGGDGGGGMKWLWYFLIYGVGNLILYKTTGIFLIPIPRR